MKSRSFTFGETSVMAFLPETPVSVSVWTVLSPEEAAAVYENELDEQINSISTMIEPILMVIMAGLIGVVVGGTLLPIYSLVNSVAS